MKTHTMEQKEAGQEERGSELDSVQDMKVEIEPLKKTQTEIKVEINI